jgi:hypothetical protein
VFCLVVVTKVNTWFLLDYRLLGMELSLVRKQYVEWGEEVDCVVSSVFAFGGKIH